MNRVRSTMTLTRLHWLEHLGRVGTAPRGPGATGYHCMVLGWTQWVMRHKVTGVVSTEAELQATVPPGEPVGPLWSQHTLVGETLTDAGREVLAAHHAGQVTTDEGRPAQSREPAERPQNPPLPGPKP